MIWYTALYFIGAVSFGVCFIAREYRIKWTNLTPSAIDVPLAIIIGSIWPVAAPSMLILGAIKWLAK